MKKSSEKYISDALSLIEKTPPEPTNTPGEYDDRHHRFFAQRTRNFAAKRAKIADDYVSAKVQGLIPGDFYRYRKTDLRLSDITPVTVSATRKSDDFKQAFFTDPAVGYIPLGALIETMGSKWLVVNPSNISAAVNSALIRRCNAVVNSYDRYGNIISEPICVNNEIMRKSESLVLHDHVLPEGDFEIICQLNDNTRGFLLNRRIMLGATAYHLTGINDFMREFTNEADSSHILTFIARLEELNASDDAENFIAGGLSHSFRLEIDGQNRITAGESAQLFALFFDGQKEIVESEKYPLDYEWSSSDPGTISVDGDGRVTAHKEGSALITASLVQNKRITTGLCITSESGSVLPFVRFTGSTPDYIKQNFKAYFNAAYFEEGIMTSEPVSWSFSGADPSSYAVEIGSDDDIMESGTDVDIYSGKLVQSFEGGFDNYSGSELEVSESGALLQIISRDITRPAKLSLIDRNVLRATADGLAIFCVHPSDTPLTVTASYGPYSASVTVELRGF